MPVFISFVLANLEYFREAHGYTLRRNRTIPGQKAHIFAPFRDAWFPQALYSSENVHRQRVGTFGVDVV
jgi:hypothetical protein